MCISRDRNSHCWQKVQIIVQELGLSGINAVGLNLILSRGQFVAQCYCVMQTLVPVSLSTTSRRRETLKTFFTLNTVIHTLFLHWRNCKHGPDLFLGHLVIQGSCLHCFGTVGWASSPYKLSDKLLTQLSVWSCRLFADVTLFDTFNVVITFNFQSDISNTSPFSIST